MMDTWDPGGSCGLVFTVAAVRRERGIYGVYVVCGPAAGCRGGGRTGPRRGGGGGIPDETGLVAEVVDNGGGGESGRNVVDAFGLIVDGEVGVDGRRSG